MTTTRIDGIDITMVDNWNEVTLEQFIDFMKWNEAKPEQFTYSYEELLYSLELISIFTSPRITKEEMDSIKIDSVKTLCDEFIKFSAQAPNFVVKDTVTIDGVQYGFADINSLPIGEYVSYQTILERSNDRVRSIPDLLSIICRPSISHKYDMELKKNIYELEKFDISKLQFRRELMLKAPAIELMGNVNFFLTGNQVSIDNSQVSGNLNQEVTEI